MTAMMNSGQGSAEFGAGQCPCTVMNSRQGCAMPRIVAGSVLLTVRLVP